MIEYKVVRSYDCCKYEEKLQEAFNEGFEFVRASEYIPETSQRYGYIEYILKRRIKKNGRNHDSNRNVKDVGESI